MDNIKTEFKAWGIYFITLLFANFFHELGHCIPVWTHGYSAIPTPAKEYPLSLIPLDLIKYVSLKGIINSAMFSAQVILYFF
jgi:hypothetical protein